MLDLSKPVVKPYPLDDLLIDLVEKERIPHYYCSPYTQKAIVAGPGGSLSKEIRLDLAICDLIPIYRRKGGGCSVFLDPGNLVISLAVPVKGYAGIQTVFNKCTDWLIKGLIKTGLKNIYRDGISDLVLNNQKIGGSCFYRSKNLAYYSATLLVSPDLDLMERYLSTPPREPVYRQGRSHRQFVTMVTRHLDGVSIKNFSSQ
ncbi:MAG: hypothetical protein PF690_01600 [Deltaproteobacteria bacterium]|jgi:lipoate-protein ligase A|nr:hypothetical protein [Deltaproteobacteria bacterium]